MNDLDDALLMQALQFHGITVTRPPAAVLAPVVPAVALPMPNVPSATAPATGRTLREVLGAARVTPVLPVAAASPSTAPVVPVTAAPPSTPPAVPSTTVAQQSRPLIFANPEQTDVQKEYAEEQGRTEQINGLIDEYKKKLDSKDYTREDTINLLQHMNDYAAWEEANRHEKDSSYQEWIRTNSIDGYPIDPRRGLPDGNDFDPITAGSFFKNLLHGAEGIVTGPVQMLNDIGNEFGDELMSDVASVEGQSDLSDTLLQQRRQERDQIRANLRAMITSPLHTANEMGESVGNTLTSNTAHAQGQDDLADHLNYLGDQGARKLGREVAADPVGKAGPFIAPLGEGVASGLTKGGGVFADRIGGAITKDLDDEDFNPTRSQFPADTYTENAPRQPLVIDQKLRKKYGEVRVNVPDETFQRVGVDKAPVYADYINLHLKHPDEFPHPEDVKVHVEFVLAHPDVILPATDPRFTFMARRSFGHKVTVVQFEKRGGKYRVHSAFTGTDEYIAGKIRQAKNEAQARQEGSQFPQILGEVAPEERNIEQGAPAPSNADPTKPTLSIPENRAGATLPKNLIGGKSETGPTPATPSTFQSAKPSPLIGRMNRLSLSDALEMYARSGPLQKQLLGDALQRKLGNASRSNTLRPQDRQRAQGLGLL